MAKVIVTLRIMPESPETDLHKVQAAVEKLIIGSVGDGDRRVAIKPVAFGLKAIEIIFVADESKGSTEPLENAIGEVAGVNSVEVTDVRRAIG